MNGRPTFAEISLTRLAENLQAVRACVGDGVEVMAVVKANAYGHGVEQAARALASAGADWFGVTGAGEAAELRRAGIEHPILLLSGFWPGEEEAIATLRLAPAIFSDEQLRLLNAEGERRGAVLPFHLKINTGMTRLGLDPDQLPGFLEQVRLCRSVRLDGLMSHFASAENPDETQSLEQMAVFQRVCGTARAAGFQPRFFHLANSAGLARFPESRHNLVRPGLALYGYQSPGHGLKLTPALSLHSRIMSVRAVPAGTPIGYGAGYVARQASRIAAVPAGYADGINRRLSNRGHALVRGCCAPIVGRVSMDLTLLDVTAIDGASPGDAVVFIGRQGRREVTAADHADWAGTIPYEILCNLGPRVPRIHLGD